MINTYLITIKKDGKVYKRIIKHGKKEALNKLHEVKYMFKNKPEYEVEYTRLKGAFEE